MRPKNENSVIYKGAVLVIPDGEIIERFKAAYPTTKNKDLEKITGRSEVYNSRLGSYLGLKKTDDFKKTVGREAAERTNAVKRGELPGKKKKTNTSDKKMNITNGIVSDGEVYELVKEEQPAPVSGAFRDCLKCGLRELCEVCYEDATASSLCGVFVSRAAVGNKYKVYFKKSGV